jgi:transaldolase
MTSNPSIFEKAIVDSHDYDEDVRAMSLKGKGAEAILETLSRCDVQSAADEFRPLYDRADGNNGYVIFIKVPVTAKGCPPSGS